jgi:hypothetical protein
MSGQVSVVSAGSRSRLKQLKQPRALGEIELKHPRSTKPSGRAEGQKDVYLRAGEREDRPEDRGAASSGASMEFFPIERL